jgi:hypothetical protein
MNVFLLETRNRSKHCSVFISIFELKIEVHKINPYTKATNTVCHIHKDIGIYFLFVRV